MKAGMRLAQVDGVPVSALEPELMLLKIRARVVLALLSLLFVSATASAQSAQSVTLAWNANTESTVTGYVLKWGTLPQIYTSYVDVGNVTTYTVNGLASNQRYYFAVVAHTATLTSAPSNEVSNDGLIIHTGGVLNDQRPGIFWHNQATGQIATWHLTGPNVIDTRMVSMVGDSHWKIAGTGDLDADGFTDLLWRHDTEGWLAAWFLVNDQVISTRMLSIDQMADMTWQIQGLGDIDGDRYADIIWQKNDGSLAAWIMRGTTVMSTRFLSIPKVSDPRWQVAGVTDTNGDGFADLIWHEPTVGSLAVWYLQGTTVTGTTFLSIDKMADTRWRIESAGDIDGSGRRALVWRNSVDGAVAVWYLQGSTVTGTYLTNPSKVVDQGWKIVGTR